MTVGIEIADFNGDPGDYQAFVTVIGAPNEDSFYAGECTIRVVEFEANGGPGTIRASAANCSDVPTVAEDVEFSVLLIEP